ncbi:MAG: cell envelope integrity protein TolA [Methylophilaceae bacterium]|nr:cell envelope integrity protein TolA [Methylophilaceae bacterium]
MIRTHENPLALRAGVLSVLVHGVLLAVLLVSFNWKSIAPASVAEVELWDKLPTQAAAAKPAQVPPVKLKPVVKVVKAPEPEAPAELKAEIQLKKKLPKPAEPKIDKTVEKKPKKTLLKPELDPKVREDKVRKLQQMLAEEDQQDARQAQKSAAQAAKVAQVGAANKAVIDGYAEKIRNKIRQFVNPQLCGAGKPEMELAVTLIPTGEVIGTPRITKSSGITACDESVERAVLQASPLPVPKESELFNQFRNLKLKFRPLD